MKKETSRIEANFSRAARTYDSFARMQKRAVDLLLEHLEGASSGLRDGAVLELGCGTGQMSYGIAQSLRPRRLVFSDISPAMIQICKERLSVITGESKGIYFQVLDAERLSETEVYALILSGLTVQWFNDFQSTLQRIYKALLPGGEFIFTCLVHGSFAQWYSVCDEVGVPCTANALLKSKEMVRQVGAVFDKLEYFSETIEIDYPSAAYFFRSLKCTGTNVQIDGVRITASQMRRLIRFWDRRLDGRVLNMTYCVDLIRAKKIL